MRINTRFPVAVHVMALMALSGDEQPTSEMMAASVGNHPVAIRQTMSMLKKAGLIETKNGLPGGKLTRLPEKITLLEIYQAVKTSEDAALFDLHPNPNPECPVGSCIRDALDEPLSRARQAMENSLKSDTLADITAFIVRRYDSKQNQN